jgi:hypothetical protein
VTILRDGEQTGNHTVARRFQVSESCTLDSRFIFQTVIGGLCIGKKQTFKGEQNPFSIFKWQAEVQLCGTK